RDPHSLPAGPRRAVPYLASLPRTPHRKRQRCSRRGRSAGPEGSRGALRPFFFPSFPPSPLPFLPPPSLSFPLSLLSLPFSLSLSRIHGRHSESYS
ncbi:hypothetical protein HGM15179_013593, partial [Zosterops borbonicus]